LTDLSLVHDPAVDLLALVVTRGLSVRFRSKKLGVELFEVEFHLALLIVFRTIARNYTVIGFCMHVRAVGGNCMVIEVRILIGVVA
jgi:hypothetical protein